MGEGIKANTVSTMSCNSPQNQDPTALAKILSSNEKMTSATDYRQQTTYSNYVYEHCFVEKKKNSIKVYSTSKEKYNSPYSLSANNSVNRLNEKCSSDRKRIVSRITIEKSDAKRDTEMFLKPSEVNTP